MLRSLAIVKKIKKIIISRCFVECRAYDGIGSTQPNKIMKRFTVPVAFTLAALVTSWGQAEGMTYPTPRDMVLSKASALCNQGDRDACQQLAFLTQGQCASPDHIGGCRFDSLAYE